MAVRRPDCPKRRLCSALSREENGGQALSVAMDAQRLTTEGASRPLSVPAGSYLDDEGMCFLPAFASGGLNWRSPSRPQGGGTSTSQGHPRTVFRRALEHDNLVLAEVTQHPDVEKIRGALDLPGRET
jgi:hypothetical protein